MKGFAPRRIGDAVTIMWAALLSTLVNWSVLARGVPVLRHDWRIPTAPGTDAGWIEGFFQPWLATGIGQAQPYPTFYLIGFLLWPIHAILTSWSTLAILTFGAMFLASYAATRIATNVGAQMPVPLIAATIATLNPWVYSKYVAGHILMVLAYAIVLAVIAEVTRERPRPYVLIILAAASITQLEFFVLVAVPLAYWCARARQWRALVALMVCALPIALGLVLRYGTVRSIPYALEWQQGQSVPLGSGLLLLGYQFHYADAFASFRPALGILGAIALYGLIRNWKTPVVRVVACFGIAAAIFASGTTGVISAPYTWIVLHVPESGVFRELYDLIAIIAISYVVGICYSLRGRTGGLVAPLMLAVSLCLALPWVLRPAFTFFVSGKSVPVVIFGHERHQRVALFPAYQPLTFGNAGSGYDPDLYAQSNSAQPLNEFFPTFPVDAAISYAWYYSDYRDLQALGVTDIIMRPYLQTNWSTLKYQQAALIRPADAPPNRRLNAPPVLSLSDGLPQLSTNPQDLFSNAIFFTDATPWSKAFRPFSNGTASLDLNNRWIDLRFAELSHPQWATAFGGIVTAGKQPVSLPERHAQLLAQVSGRLLNQSSVKIATSTPALHWWNLPPGTTSVHCAGVCALVLLADPPSIPKRVPTPRWSPIEYHSLSPWAISATVSAHPRPQTLRFAEAYGPYWLAISNMHILPHVRLNTVLNGWEIQPGDSSRIIIVEIAALLQFICECLAATVVLVLLLSLHPSLNPKQ